MPEIKFGITMSLDGFVAGPDMSPEQGFGRGGERLRRWAIEPESFQEAHGRSGREANQVSAILDEALRSPGAVIMGRRMFGGGDGRWG